MCVIQYDCVLNTQCVFNSGPIQQQTMLNTGNRHTIHPFLSPIDTI